MVAFPVATWSLQRVSQMEYKDMLHVTYRLKIAVIMGIRHFPLRDGCP
jgi:hypothetical protein